MPTWNEVVNEINAIGAADACDRVRQKYIRKLENRVQRTVICYYSGFLQKRGADGRAHPEASISDLDMNGIMTVAHNVERNRGLDLILHTPGGGTEATRALVEYLYKMFGKDIRVVVPHMAMSAGTMIACAAQEVLMGKHSCLGPTDPQVRGLPAMGVLAEADRAIEEVTKNPAKKLIYQQIFAKYPPAFLLDCERSVANTRTMVRDWLRNGMFEGEQDADKKAERCIDALMDYEGTSEHAHHFLVDKCRDMGIKAVAIEDDQELQEDVLSVHHSFVATFAAKNAIKIIENSIGSSWVVSA